MPATTQNSSSQCSKPSGQQGPSLQTLTISAINLSSGGPGTTNAPLSHMSQHGSSGSCRGGDSRRSPRPDHCPIPPFSLECTTCIPTRGNFLRQHWAAVQSLPSQPITSAMVRMNTPAFPLQTLVPGYPSYVAPSLYGTSQPPVTNGSFISLGDKHWLFFTFHFLH
jgi:hypothetical protein